MPQDNPEFIYREAGIEAIDAVHPLWHKLNVFHSGISTYFSDKIRIRQFEPRKQEIIAKSKAGKVRIEFVSLASTGEDVAYCISSVGEAGVAEIDSVFVDERFRRHGIGHQLLTNALAWIDPQNPTAVIISVMHENEEAIAFYRQFGFFPRSVLLRQNKDLMPKK